MSFVQAKHNDATDVRRKSTPPHSKSNKTADHPVSPLWQRLATGVQPKVNVGAPADEYEQEADHVSSRVMRMADSDSIEDEEPIQPKRLNASPVQRLCSECDQEAMGQVQPKSDSPARGTPPSLKHAVSAPGSGSAVHPQVRRRVEPILGADLSGVRVHSGSGSRQAAKDINAKAFTYRNNIHLGEGQNSRDIGLMAHELTHVVQQGESGERVQTKKPDNSTGKSTGTSQAGSQGGSLATAGKKQCDSNESNPVIWFEYDSTRLRTSGGANSFVHLMSAVRRSQSHISAAGPGAVIYLYGYASEEGDEEYNLDLSTRRAETVKSLLEDAGIASANLKAVGLGEDDSMGALPWNRRVEICPTPTVQHIDMPAETVTADTVDCDAPTRATNLTEYSFLVRCLEDHLAATHGPVDILRTLREIYYGGSRFDSAACGDRESGTVSRLATTAPDLLNALRVSKVTGGVDVGHVFTGLEGMLCPTTTTDLAWYAPTVNMSNEDVLTWGGDIGSAAAGRLRGYHDSGIVFKSAPPWSRYFLRPGSLASREDLRGDIDAFTMRAIVKGFSCSATQGTRMPAPTTPVSRLLLDYYSAPTGMGTSLNASDRFRCFVEAVGGTISGGSIVNKAALVSRYTPHVLSFAHLYYLGMRWHHVGTMDPADLLRLRRYSKQVTDRFFDWTESNL